MQELAEESGVSTILCTLRCQEICNSLFIRNDRYLLLGRVITRDKKWTLRNNRRLSV